MGSQETQKFDDLRQELKTLTDKLSNQYKGSLDAKVLHELLPTKDDVFNDKAGYLYRFALIEVALEKIEERAGAKLDSQAVLKENVPESLEDLKTVENAALSQVVEDVMGSTSLRRKHLWQLPITDKVKSDQYDRLDNLIFDLNKNEPNPESLSFFGRMSFRRSFRI